MNLQDIRKSVTKFNTLKAAKEYTYRTIKPTLVVKGDDGLFWIVTGRQFQILKNLGYKEEK